MSFQFLPIKVSSFQENLSFQIVTSIFPSELRLGLHMRPTMRGASLDLMYWLRLPED